MVKIKFLAMLVALTLYTGQSHAGSLDQSLGLAKLRGLRACLATNSCCFFARLEVDHSQEPIVYPGIGLLTEKFHIRMAFPRTTNAHSFCFSCRTSPGSLH